MPSSEQPQISAGQPLDVQPGVSNIGENQAELDALRNANIDGQDIFPQSVSTRRFSAEDGAFSGNIYAGSMLIGAGGVTITSDPDLGTPNTGLYLDSSVLYLIKDGVATVTLNGITGSATFTGAITGGTISSMGSVNFGTNVTVGGNLIVDGNVRVHNSDTIGYLYFTNSSITNYISYDTNWIDIKYNTEFTVSSDLAKTSYLDLQSAAAAANSSATIGSDGYTYCIGALDTKIICGSGWHGALAFGNLGAHTEVLYWSDNVVNITATTGLRIQSAAYILSGAGAPAAGLGATGDIYLSTGGSFYVKQAAGWRRIDDWVS